MDYKDEILASFGPAANSENITSATTHGTPESVRSSIADFRDTVETDSQRAWKTKTPAVSPVPGPSRLPPVGNTALLSPGSGFLTPKSSVTSSTALGLGGAGDYFADSVQHEGVKNKLSSAPASPIVGLTAPLPQVENPIPVPQVENPIPVAEVGKPAPARAPLRTPALSAKGK